MLPALLCSLISACLFSIGEFKMSFSDWLTVLHTHVQSRFHVFLIICKRGVGYLPFNLCAHELRMCLIFPTLPLRGSIKLGPCDRCFGPEWIPFPFTDFLSLNIQAVLGPTHHFAHFFLRGLMFQNISK